MDVFGIRGDIVRKENDKRIGFCRMIEAGLQLFDIAFVKNADTAAAKIAGELGAEALISMTDISGILRDKNDPETLIPVISVSEAPALYANGTISGGMIPKVECCINAINWGVRKVFIIDGRIPHAILIETLTNEGIGTMFINE